MAGVIADDKKIGPAIVLKVMSGDKFNLRVSSWYNQFTDGDVNNEALLEDLIGILSAGVSENGSTHSTADMSPKSLDFLPYPLKYNRYKFSDVPCCIEGKQYT